MSQLRFILLLLFPMGLWAETDSTKANVTPLSLPEAAQTWMRWADGLAQQAGLWLYRTETLGLPTALRSPLGPQGSPIMGWEGLPMLESWSGQADPDLIPGDAVVNVKSGSSGTDRITVHTRHFDAPKPLSRFRYRSGGGFSDFDIGLGMGFSSRIRSYAAGFRQRYTSETEDSQKADRGYAALDIDLGKGWCAGYAALRNSHRATAPDTLIFQHTGKMADARLNRLRYDHRFHIQRNRGRWTTRLDLGHADDTWQWRSTGFDTLNVYGGDTQWQLSHARQDSSGMLSFGIHGVQRTLNPPGLPSTHDGWITAFASMERGWGAWQFSGSVEVYRFEEIDEAWQIAGQLTVKRPLAPWLTLDMGLRRTAQAPSLGLQGDYFEPAFISSNTILPELHLGQPDLDNHNARIGNSVTMGLEMTGAHVALTTNFFVIQRTNSVSAFWANGEAFWIRESDQRFWGLSTHGAVGLPAYFGLSAGFNWTPEKQWDEPVLSADPAWWGHGQLRWGRALFQSDMIINVTLIGRFWGGIQTTQWVDGQWTEYILDPGVQVDAQLSARILKQGWVALTAENLADATHQRLPSIPLHGRCIRLGFVWELID